MLTPALRAILADKKLSHWQAAADGQWETAIPIPLNPAAAFLVELNEWIERSPQDIALEAFFKDDAGEFCFFGIRIEKLHMEEKQAFLQNVLTASGDTVPDIMANIAKAIKEPALPAGPIDILEIGAEGFWRSYGSYVAWTRAQGGAIAGLNDIGRDAPQILKPFQRSMMLEVAWHLPLPMWIGLQTSDWNGGSWAFSPERYTALIAATGL